MRAMTSMVGGIDFLFEAKKGRLVDNKGAYQRSYDGY
jgi:hypothetical protein